MEDWYVCDVVGHLVISSKTWLIERCAADVTQCYFWVCLGPKVEGV